ncbi:receptor-like protein 12 [Tanacetum coccineum]
MDVVKRRGSVLFRQGSIDELSNNNLDSLLPNFPNASVSMLEILDLSSSKLGEIPREMMIGKTICNAVYLDLSNNRLTGMIPQCLIECGNGFGVLNLAKKGLTGQIEGGNISNNLKLEHSRPA